IAATFAYHGRRVYAVGGYPRGLLAHHLLLVVIYTYVTLTGHGVAFATVGAIPTGTAIVRNLGWAKHAAPPLFPFLRRRIAKIVYTGGDIVPCALVVLWYLRSGILLDASPLDWVFAYGPSLLTIGLSTYWGLTYLGNERARRIGELSAV